MTAKKPDRLAVLRDEFVMSLLKQAREFGIAEERKRIVDYLNSMGLQNSARHVEGGEHDGGRRFKAESWRWPEDEDLPAAGQAEQKSTTRP